MSERKIMSEIRYHLSFSEPQAHLIDVEMRFRPSTPETVLWMPVWTPGSYLVREFSRHVQELTATSAADTPLAVTKTSKNRWAIACPAGDEITVRYRLYAREKSVRTNWVDCDYAFLTGAATFFAVEGMENVEHRVAVTLPPGWHQNHCALPRTDHDGHTEFTATDFDELVDSPMLMGNPAWHEYMVDGKPVALVNQGEGGLWDGRAAAMDTKVIVETYRDLYGSVPFDRYLFLNLIVQSGGGLEHKNSSVLMGSRYAYRDREKYIDWLGLVSHEFFHVWNVKRSRPVELGPFDYENEVYTRSLWVAEGFTAYYTDLMPRRAGLTTDLEYLDDLGKLVNRLTEVPGRGLQSLEESSFDAWIKLYRADENTANTTVSYYLKGALVTWLLDTRIRTATNQARTLDDLMRLLFDEYSGEHGFSPEQLQAAAESVAGESLQDFFDDYVRGTTELDFTPALAMFGLRFTKPEDKRNAWLGVETANRGGKLVVTKVRADGPSRHAGLNAEDEILALGGYRVDQSTLTTRLKQYAPETRVDLLVSRSDAVRIVPVVLGETPRKWKLEVDPDAPDSARETRATWLGPIRKN